MKTLSISLYRIPKTIIILFLISIPSLVHSQNNQEICTNNVRDTSIYEENIVGEPLQDFQQYLGQNFFNIDWPDGTIVLENGEKIYNKIINYQLLTHDLVWMRDSYNNLIVVKKEIVKEFVILNDSGVKSLFRKIKIQRLDKTDSVEEYLQVLSQGYINLYAFRKSILGQKSQKLIPNNDYYIQVNNGEIKRLKLYRWFLYSAVSGNNKLMKKIVRRNHLRIRKEYGLIKAVNLFNQEIKQAKN
jgi:hypothetical protein